MSMDRLKRINEILELEREASNGMSGLIGYMMGALKAINESGSKTSAEHIAELAGKVVEEAESRWKIIVNKRSESAK